jgi:hypothetical protein
LAGVGAVPQAHAYSSSEAFAEPPGTGGGGGRWFSGSPADGFSCGVCHLPTPSLRRFPLYVAGLPSGTGYALAAKQQIVLSWPEFAARWMQLRPDPTAPPAAGAAVPSMGVVTELVAESGKGSGVIEIDTAAAGPGELCEKTRPNLKPRVAAQLYQVRPGLDPLLVKPDSAGVLRCEAHQLGQRCIVAVNSCGAHEARFTWTAPQRWQGAIWFSAGFVASEALDGTPNGDSVQEVSLPIVQAGTPSGTYQQTLHNGCTLFAGRAAPRAGASIAALAAIALYARRRARRTRERG